MARFHLVLGAFAVALAGCGAMDGGETIESTKSALAIPSCAAAPGPDEAYLYALDGQCYVAPRGWNVGELYPPPGGGSIPNDTLVSVRLGSDVRVVIFVDHFYLGAKRILVTDTDGLPHNTSSYRVEYRSDQCEVSSFRPYAGAITIYRDINYQGDCAVLHAWDPNNFGHPGLLYDYGTGLANDSVSSAYIGPFTSPIFYHDDSALDANEIPEGPSHAIPNSLSVPQGVPNFSGVTNIGNDNVSALWVRNAS